MGLEAAQERIRIAEREESRELDLSGLDLFGLDLQKLLNDNIAFFQKIESLDVSRNKIGLLPFAIGSLTNLTSLDLRINVIKDIPFVIGSLTNLTSLCLRDNEISEIPFVIGNFRSLTSLDLSHNGIREVSSAIGSLTNLRNLDLECNLISDIPSVFANMRSMQMLRLGDNPLTAATRGFIDSIPRTQIRIEYDMSAHEQVNSEVTGLGKLCPEAGKSTEILNQINALGEVERQAVKTFLSRIQNSRYWRDDNLFNRYFKKTIADIIVGIGYDSPGRPNQILQDIVKSSEGCGTNSTGTVFSYYAKSAIAKWLKDNVKGKIEHADLVRIGGVLKSDISHIALQEYASALISENDIDGDRAEAIADLLRIANGSSFNFGVNDYKIANPLTLPDSISAYGLTANNRAKEVFLFGLCKTKDDGSLDISSSNGLTIDESKLEVIVNNYLAMHDISVSDGMGWFTRLSSILKDPSKMIPDNELKNKNEEIRRIYQKLYSEHYDHIEGDEFIQDLTKAKNSEQLLSGVSSEVEYLDKVLNKLSQVLGDIEAKEGGDVDLGEASRGFDYKGVAAIAAVGLCVGGLYVANSLGFNIAYSMTALALIGGGLVYLRTPPKEQEISIVEPEVVEIGGGVVVSREQSSDNLVPDESEAASHLENLRNRVWPQGEEVER